MDISTFELLEPKDLAFCRYLPRSILREKIEMLASKINRLREKVHQLDAALDVCHSYAPSDDFASFIEALSWILSAARRNRPADIENLHNNIMVAGYVNTNRDCWTNLIACIEDTNAKIDVLEKNLNHLTKIMEDGNRPLPIPQDFFSKNLSAVGDVVIGYSERDQEGPTHMGPIWAAIVTCPMVDHKIAVRPLTDAEYRKFGLEALRSGRADNSLGYFWAMSRDTYLFYQEHPETIAEHLAAFEAYNGSRPTFLLALQAHFS